MPDSEGKASPVPDASFATLQPDICAVCAHVSGLRRSLVAARNKAVRLREYRVPNRGSEYWAQGIRPTLSPIETFQQDFLANLCLSLRMRPAKS